MSKDATSSDPNNGHVERDGQGNSGGPSSDDAPIEDNWKQVVDEYRRVVKALNRNRVSFTVRSAEGITLYGGLDTHSANGNMRRLANIGHTQLLKRVNGARAADAQGERAGTKMPGSRTQTPD